MASQVAPPGPQWVFLLDVDNTLLDNDRFESDLRRFLLSTIGEAGSTRYWAIVEELRARLGYVDFLGAVQQLRTAFPREPELPRIGPFLLGYPFRDRLYPGVDQVVQRLGEFGTTVILSDGDAVFQPLKIDRSGLADRVGGRVMVCVHKEDSLDEVERRFPADRYALIDDKLRILTAVKGVWGERVTTLQPRQGHYALDSALQASFPAADLSVERIGELSSQRAWPWAAPTTPGGSLGR
ncbi:MAG: HAD family hydrolase [Thermoplasmata archaeon]|nr:HAD family hydrolase [Thermoplasmata archaeon]